jgi:hypothetical protein
VVTEHVVRNVWIAAWLIVAGLPFVRATAGARGRTVFVFDDPDDCAAELTRTFRADRRLQRFIDARCAVNEMLEVVHARGVCEPDDVADALAMALLESGR